MRTHRTRALALCVLALGAWPHGAARAQQGPLVTGRFGTPPPIVADLSAIAAGPGASGAALPSLPTMARAAIVLRAIDDAYVHGEITDRQRKSLKAALPVLSRVAYSSFGVGGSVAQDAAGQAGGGGATPRYEMSGPHFAAQFGINTAARQDVTVDPRPGKATIASALLNPGALTQGINVLARLDWRGVRQEPGRVVVAAIGRYLRANWAALRSTPAVTELEKDWAGLERLDANRARLLAASLYRKVQTEASANARADTGQAPAEQPTSDADDMGLLTSAYMRLNIAGLDVTGADPADAAQTLTVPCNLVAPTVGLQFDYGDRMDGRKLHFGGAIGLTGRLLGGDITRRANSTFMQNTVGRKSFWGPEATVYVSYQGVQHYVRWTHMGSGDLAGFSGDQFVFGFEMAGARF